MTKASRAGREQRNEQSTKGNIILAFVRDENELFAPRWRPSPGRLAVPELSGALRIF